MSTLLYNVGSDVKLKWFLFYIIMVSWCSMSTCLMLLISLGQLFRKMALRKVNKLKLKSKKNDLSVVALKKQIPKVPPSRVEGAIDDDCMIIDDDNDARSKESETFVDRKENYSVPEEERETEDLPFDLKELRKHLVLPLPAWGLADIMKLSDLPEIEQKEQGELTQKKVEQKDLDIKELSPLPHSCKCCMRQSLKYFAGWNFKQSMTNIPCDFDRTTKYSSCNKFEKCMNSEIKSLKGASLPRKVETEKALGNFPDDNGVEDNSLGRKNNSSRFEKMKRKIATQNKTREVSEKTAIKHLKLNTVLENDVSFQTKAEQTKKATTSNVEQLFELEETKEPQLKGHNSSFISSKSSISVCPLCQIQFSLGHSQLDIDGHIAKCLSQAGDDVIW